MFPRSKEMPVHADFPALSGRRAMLVVAIALLPVFQSRAAAQEDKLKVFRTEVGLAVIDWNANRPQLAHNRLGPLLAADAGQIDREVYSWGEIVDGLVLGDLGRKPEALALLEGVARDRRVSAGRRSSAASGAADLMLRNSPAEALGLLREIADLPGGATPQVEGRISHLLLITGRADELRRRLSGMIDASADSGEGELASLLKAAASWNSPNDERRMEMLADMIAALRPDPGEALRKAVEACRMEAASRSIYARLMELLAVKPLSGWYAPAETDRQTSLANFQGAIAEAFRQGDPGRCLRLSLRALAAHGTEMDFPRRLWDAASYADWNERELGQAADPEICARLLDLCDRLPSGQDFFVEGKFLRAKRLARAGDRPGEQAVLGEIVGLPGLSLDFLAPGCRMLGSSLETTGDYRGALDTYKLMESAADRYPAAADCLLRAVLINQRLGNDDEAVRLIRILQQAPSAVVQGAAGAAQIRELIALVQTGQAVRLGVAHPAHSFGPEIAAQASPPGVVAGWIRSISLPWYDYAEPESLDDSRLQNLEDTLKNPETLFSPAEQIKLLLLAAQDRRRPIEWRRQSLRGASLRILDAAPGYGQLNAVAASVIDNPGFDLETRLQMLGGALAILSAEGRKADYDRWRASPLVKGFNPDFQRKFLLLDEEAGLDRTSPEAILRLANKIAGRTMTSFGALTMRDLLGFLLRLGELRDAEAIAAAVPSWKFGGDLADDGAAVKLEFARRIRLARSANAVHEALASAVRAAFPEAPQELPPEYRDLRIDAGLPARGPEATFQACRYLVETRQFNRGDFGFWGTLLGAVPRRDDQAEIVGALLRAGLRTASDDEIRSELIVLFFTSTDTDDPGIRRAIEQEFAPYRRPVDYPLSYLVIRLYEVHRDLRLGAPVELETAFSDLNDPRTRLVQARASLRSYTQTGNRAALQRVVDRIDSGRLLSPGFVAQAIPAFELLGMAEERRMALEAAGHALREAVLDSWVRHDESSGATALDLALAVGDPAALPAAWVSAMSSGSGDPRFQGRVRLVAAYLGSDWGRVEQEAAQLNRDYPASYAYYWYRGLASHKLGRDREAAEALSIYVRYAHDGLEYPQAVEILRQLAKINPDLRRDIAPTRMAPPATAAQAEGSGIATKEPE
jgi:tetratricopeptide (TPR) repeat protein